MKHDQPGYWLGTEFLGAPPFVNLGGGCWLPHDMPAGVTAVGIVVDGDSQRWMTPAEYAAFDEVRGR